MADGRSAQQIVADALAELRHLTTCSCHDDWTSRGRHETHCAAAYREDVETLAGLLADPATIRRETLEAAAEQAQQNSPGSESNWAYMATWLRARARGNPAPVKRQTPRPSVWVEPYRNSGPGDGPNMGSANRGDA